jgi:hypothetical protein
MTGAFLFKVVHLPHKKHCAFTQNKANVEEFYNNMQDQGTGFRYLKDLDADLLASATRLIRFISKEYKLDGE